VVTCGAVLKRPQPSFDDAGSDLAMASPVGALIVPRPSKRAVRSVGAASLILALVIALPIAALAGNVAAVWTEHEGAVPLAALGDVVPENARDHCLRVRDNRTTCAPPSSRTRPEGEERAPGGAPSLVVERMTFGFISKSGLRGESGDPIDTRVIRSRLITDSATQEYGWRVYLNTARHTVRVREELDEPHRIPKEADEQPGVSVSADRHRIAIQRDMPVGASGIVWDFWLGDAPGRYELRVYVENALAGRFPYVVRKRTEPTGSPDLKRSGCTDCNSTGSLKGGGRHTPRCFWADHPSRGLMAHRGVCA
jgi:hypothetical protein